MFTKTAADGKPVGPVRQILRLTRKQALELMGHLQQMTPEGQVVEVGVILFRSVPK